MSYVFLFNSDYFPHSVLKIPSHDIVDSSLILYVSIHSYMPDYK